MGPGRRPPSCLRPLVRLTRVTRDLGPVEAQPLILGKLETMNPGGSVKDRIGLPMIEAAERAGLLKPGGTIAFSTWPPELFTGRMFALVSRYAAHASLETGKACDEKIRSRFAVQLVAGLITEDAVIARTSPYDVALLASVYLIVASASEDDVWALPGVDRVVPTVGDDAVGARGAENDVIELSSLDHVEPGRAHVRRERTRARRDGAVRALP